MSLVAHDPVRSLIPRHAVKSSQISEIGYDKASCTLAVQFHPRLQDEGASVYHYQNITEDMWEDFRKADSVGSFFSKHIRPNNDRFPYTKIEPAAVKEDAAVEERAS